MPVPPIARKASADWASQGACLYGDPDLFCPIARSGPALQQVVQAKAICARCPVRIDCFSYALETGQDAAVWAAPPRKSAGRSGQPEQPRRHRRCPGNTA